MNVYTTAERIVIEKANHSMFTPPELVDALIICDHCNLPVHRMTVRVRGVSYGREVCKGCDKLPSICVCATVVRPT